ncbi:chaperone protein [Colletotrichum incanum]|uniref:Chaperone protein n=1 Tax=Colletotrichum incanum TaxID=1573173 RepID=A0A162NTL7_COLIC|nr:chaperone protein [Colletotrichum incanum]
MQPPPTQDYYWDLGIEQRVTLEEIRQAYKILENKNFTDNTEILEKVQHDSSLTDSVPACRNRARTAYESLSQPSKRAKYDKDYARVRAAWFRYRKWTEWQEEGEKPARRGCDSSDNRLTKYSRKLINKMRDGRAQQLTVVVDATHQNGAVEEVLDAAEPEEEQASQVQSKTPRVTETITSLNTTESNSESSGKRVRQPRKAYVDSYPQERSCIEGGHYWQGWWPTMEVFISPACLSFCLTCRLAQ